MIGPADFAIAEADLAADLPQPWRVTVTAALYGPFASREAIRCTGTPVFKTSFRAKGSGIYAAPPAMLDKVGLAVTPSRRS